jgi:hypothetical protein
MLLSTTAVTPCCGAPCWPRPGSGPARAANQEKQDHGDVTHSGLGCFGRRRDVVGASRGKGVYRYRVYHDPREGATGGSKKCARCAYGEAFVRKGRRGGRIFSRGPPRSARRRAGRHADRRFCIFEKKIWARARTDREQRAPTTRTPEGGPGSFAFLAARRRLRRRAGAARRGREPGGAACAARAGPGASAAEPESQHWRCAPCARAAVCPPFPVVPRPRGAVAGLLHGAAPVSRAPGRAWRRGERMALTYIFVLCSGGVPCVLSVSSQHICKNMP